ncbi:MAG: hypothetical protein CBC13_00740 [Planctomycetia bacterium TMED53]|nr:MAG: hypothetical protein CBC13_00740 [Planctomycetia bacterium TMED53]
MSLIPRWLGKKGFVALLSFIVIFLLLVILLAMEYRNRNLRLMAEIAKISGHKDFTAFSQWKIENRDSNLFPLRSREEIDAFLMKNAGRIALGDDEEVLSEDSLKIITDYDQEFLEVVRTASGREPIDADKLLSNIYNIAGVRSRLVSLIDSARLRDQANTSGKLLSSALEANENLNGGGFLIGELVRMSIISEFMKQIRFQHPYTDDQLSTEDLELLLRTLNRLESPKIAIKRAIQAEVLASIELIYGDKSKFFPQGVWGYLYEPDVHFYLSYQKQLLTDLEEVGTLEELTRMGKVPWYAIYTSALGMGDPGNDRAFTTARYTESMLEYHTDFLKILLHYRKTGQPYDGDLSNSSKVTVGEIGDDQILRLEYAGTAPPSGTDDPMSREFVLP